METIQFGWTNFNVTKVGDDQEMSCTVTKASKRDACRYMVHTQSHRWDIFVKVQCKHDLLHQSQPTPKSDHPNIKITNMMCTCHDRVTFLKRLEPSNLSSNPGMWKVKVIMLPFSRGHQRLKAGLSQLKINLYTKWCCFAFMLLLLRVLGGMAVKATATSIAWSQNF